MDKKVQYLTILLLSIACLGADTLYVDCQLSADCISNTYNPQTRSCEGGGYKGYKNLQQALNDVQMGDVILGREGRYHPGPPLYRFEIPSSKQGISWNDGEYYTLRSADNEWMILDGQDSIPGGSMYAVLGRDTGLSYWKFERLEITGGKIVANDREARGFHADAGPFIFRYCYIHTNLARDANNIPAGISGHRWSNSLVEYCYFKDNGSVEDTWVNASHIIMYSDYNSENIGTQGFVDLGTGKHTMKNVWRYNLFEGASNGIWITKAPQYFTGRNTGYIETAKTYGDKIHHNLFIDITNWAITLNQDFVQVYNNIVYNCGTAIATGYTTTQVYPYKSVIYNNSYIKTKRGPLHLQTNWNAKYILPNPNYYAWHINELADTMPTFTNSERYEEFAVIDNGTITGASQDSFFVNRCYSYRPASHSFDNDATRMIYMGTTRYTIDQFKTLRSGVELWMNGYEPDNSLYKGTSEADALKTRGEHVLAGSTTIANGGIGGPHPYLEGITLPSYIGATDPDDDNWVDEVLSLRNLADRTTNIDSERKLEFPEKSALKQNYPNPFNPVTNIEFQISKHEFVSLKIYDTLGREVVTLVNKTMSAGKHTVQWDGTNSAGHQAGSGVYFYRLKCESGFSKAMKMILLY